MLHLLATQYFLRLSRVCGRSLKEESLPLFVLFVLFGQAKSTLCFMYFCMTKSTKSHLRGSLLEISLSFPALPKRKHHNPPVRTYRVNRPTAGKGRSAGSNARVVCSTLLCAMPIRQGFMPFPLSAHRLHTRPPHLYMRAWNQRIRESARFFRVMCSHAWYG